MITSIEFIETGYFKLDGGAMFGVVPKSMWAKLNPPDENNMCTWSMRCLLIRTEDRCILVDTGMGDKQDEKFRSFFYPHGEDHLIGSIKKLGLGVEDITDVFLTHLHFDHCGGAVSRDQNGQLYPTFPKARYWSNEVHWKWAMEPNDRERASFLKENFLPLLDANVLNFIPVTTLKTNWIPDIDVHFIYGHTEAMMLVEFEYKGQSFLYCADLFPSSYHISIPFIMSYDVRPLVSIAEKHKFLIDAIDKDQIFILEHDPKFPCCKVGRNEHGRFVIQDYPTLS
ncbi:MAG: MBL fold metallo-hydrolase [Bacteroidota bacterium]|nr:MBL fold metallo-hydrolase [Bacteroidota bacterium]